MLDCLTRYLHLKNLLYITSIFATRATAVLKKSTQKLSKYIFRNFLSKICGLIWKMREGTFNIMMALFGLSFFSGWIYLMIDSNSHLPKPENLEFDEDPSKTWKLFEVN